MIRAVIGVVFVGAFMGCGSGRDSLIISGGEGGNATDALTDTSQGARSGDSAPPQGVELQGKKQERLVAILQARGV